MNRQTYRVIFSRIANTFIAVAEISNEKSKTKNTSVCQCSILTFNRSAIRRITMLSAMIAFMFFSTQLVHAQMVAYRSNHGPRPVIDQTANGRSIVNIVTPNSVGLSHNRYELFNVDAHGAILNNSPTIVQTRLGGYVEGNPYLSSGNPAKVILNEVMSTDRSLLNGYIEVAGQHAEVVLANPNGISVGGGAGFINASHAVLTTGTPTLNSAGSLVTFRVNQGDIKVESGGLNGTGVDQLDLIARSVQLNDNLWANKLNVITGSNQVDYNGLGVQVITQTGVPPTVGIDSSAMGGMYAQKITLIGTEAGVGVKLLGDISATNGDVIIDSRGRVILNARATASGNLTLRSDDDVTLNGTLYSQQSVNIFSERHVSNVGTLAAMHDVNVQAGSLASSGVLAAGLDGFGQLTQTGNLNVSTSGLLTASGDNLAGNDVMMSGLFINLAHSHTSAKGEARIIATEGSINHRNAELNVAGAATLNAAQEILNDEGVINAAQLNIHANSLSNKDGALIQTGNSNTLIEAIGWLDNTGGTMMSNGQDVRFHAGGLINHDGEIKHAGTGTLAMSVGELNNVAGLIISNGEIDIDSKNFNNQGGQLISNRRLFLIMGGDLNNAQGNIQSAHGLLIASGSINNAAGRIISLNSDGLSLSAQGVITNVDGITSQGEVGGIIGSNGDTKLSATQLVNSGTISASHDLSAHIQQQLNNNGGRLAAANTLQVQANALSNAHGMLGANHMRVNVAELNNANGNISADQLMVYANNLSNQHGQLIQYGKHAGVLEVTDTLDNSEYGLIQTNSTELTLTSRQLNNNDGAILHAGSGTLSIEVDDGHADLHNVGGNISTNGQLKLNAGNLNNHHGKLNANEAAVIHVKGDLDNTEGRLQAGGALNIKANSLDNSAGQLLSFNADGVIIEANDQIRNFLSGTIAGNGDVWLKTKHLINDSAITAAHNFIAVAGYQLTNHGRIASGDQLQLTAGDLDNSQGVIDASTVSISAQQLNNHAGSIAADQLFISTRDFFNQKGQVKQYAKQGAGIYVTGVLNNSDHGVIQVNSDDLTLTSRQFINNDGVIAHAGSGTLTLTVDRGAGSLENQAGNVGSNGSIIIKAGDIHNQSGQLYGQEKVNLQTTWGGIDNSDHGYISGSQLNLNVAGNINNANGKIEGTSDGVEIVAGELINTAGAIQNLGASRLHFQLQHLDNTSQNNVGGFIGSVGDMEVSAITINNSGGTIYSQGEMQVQANESLTNLAGTLQSGAAMLVASNVLNNQYGRIETNADNNEDSSVTSLTVHSKNIDNSFGRIANSNTGATYIKSDNSIVNAVGTIGGNGDVTLHTKELINTEHGKVIAGRNLNLEVINQLNNAQGNLFANNDLILQQGDVTLVNKQGSVSASGNIYLQVATLDNTSGQIASAIATQENQNIADSEAGNVKVSASNISNTDGVIGSTRDLDLQTLNLSGNGVIAAGRDAMLHLQGDYALSAGNVIHANRDLTFTTSGTFNNSGTLESVRNLTVTANTINNYFGALINAGNGTTLVNATNALYNLGRIYGDDIAISANLITNDGILKADGNTYHAGVIAARRNIDLAARTIINREHAVLQSLGNLVVGGVLDANLHAVGTAGYLLNSSATIDAGVNLSLQTEQLDNLNAHFSAMLQHDPNLDRYVTYFMIDGSSNKFYYSTDADVVNRNGVHKLRIYSNLSEYNNYTTFVFNEKTWRTVVTQSDPATISAGGNIVLSGKVLNDKSAILAGGAVLGQLSGLENRDATGANIVQRGGDGFLPNGDPASLSIHHGVKNSCEWGIWDCYDEDDYSKKTPFAETVRTDNAALNIFKYVSHLSPAQLSNDAIGAGVNSRIVPIGNTDTLGNNQGAQQVVGEGQAVGHAAGSSGENTVLMGQLQSVDTASGPNDQSTVMTGNAQTVGSSTTPIPHLILPNSQLFPVTKNPTANYVIETDPQFTNYHAFLSSDYLFSRLSLDPQQIKKRLGDGFYEQKLINDQIAQLTGNRFLGHYTNNEEQYQALMESGVKVAEQFQLTPGIALTADQMAALTSDMVWLVAQEILMPDGSRNKVWVPVVYLAHSNSAELQTDGSIISGRDINLSVHGQASNGGTMHANNTLIHATDITNTGTVRANNGSAVLMADNDIINQGGVIAGNRVDILAGRDVVMTTTISHNQNAVGSASNGMSSEINVINQVAAVFADQLTIQSGRDVQLVAAQINSTGNTTMAAGRDIQLGVVDIKEAREFNFGERNHLSYSQTTPIGTQISAGGNVVMSAAQDVNAQAAYVNSDGGIAVQAGRDINLSNTQQQSSYEQETYSSSGNWLSSSVTHTQLNRQGTQSIGSTLSGDSVQMVAGNNVNVIASNVVATNDVTLVAGNDIQITTSLDSVTQSYQKEESKSGFFSNGGIGITYGDQYRADSSQDRSVLHQGSLIGSVSGTVTLAAAGDVNVQGSEVIAKNDINMVGRNIEISHVQNQFQHTERHEFQQSGLTLSLTSPTINVATSVAQSVQRANEVDDPRLKKFYVAKGVASGWVNSDGIQSEAHQLAEGDTRSLSVNLSFGSSQSQSSSKNEINYVQSSQVNAGGNLNLIANDGGTMGQGNISVTGSELNANNMALIATNDIVLQSAQNNSMSRSDNDSSGWSAGIGVSLGVKSGVTFSATGYQADGSANANSTAHTNTQLNAANQLNLVSGRDVVLQGAAVNANQINANIGRDLTITSIQDLENYQSEQQALSVGASYTYGAGISGNLSANWSSTDADFAGVFEQSGFNAGENGFNIIVGNHTQLNGGIISSVAGAEKNSLNTGSLGLTNITNQKHFESHADSIGMSTGSALYEIGKSVAGGLSSHANALGSGRSLTLATISPAPIEVRNGDTSALITLNRDASLANRVLELDNVKQIEQDTQNRSEAGQVLFDVATQFIDKAHEVILSSESNASKVYRVICKQEPCTYDPATQSDPNRHDKQDNPNVVMMEITQEDIKNMSPEERNGLVIETNGILNDVQRAGELAQGDCAIKRL